MAVSFTQPPSAAPPTRIKVKAAEQVRQVGRRLLQAGQQELQHERGARVAARLVALPALCRCCGSVAT